MRNKPLFIAWLLIPVAMLAWHLGPGQAALHRDMAGDRMREAARGTLAEDWRLAADSYAAARDLWPDHSVPAQRRLALAQATATIQAGELIPGQEQMESLLKEMEADAAADPELLAATRHELAMSSYYAAWIMRLEGATVQEWKPEADRARQQFRMLAEIEVNGSPRQDQPATAAQKNLEAAIRLEQMDLTALMAKPLPKNCCSNCKNICQKKRKQSAGRCRSKDGQEENQDARKEIKQSNSAGLLSGQLDGS